MVMTDSIDVRVAGTAHIDAVLGIDHVTERADEVRTAIDRSRCLVAERAGELIGFCIGGQFFGFDFLDLLLVAAHQRRQGAGTALVTAWEMRAETTKLFTSTNESNVPMQRLCEHLGYVRSGFIENLDEGDPEVIYFKVNDRL
jgi:GNAT superfamily N-acetyltransferase